MKFELNEQQLAKLAIWQKEQDNARITRQRVMGSFASRLADDGIPYYGAVGGEITFLFTPTSIGDIVKVKHSDGAELDLTDEGNFG